MEYLIMDALLIKAELECVHSENAKPFSFKLEEKYNNVISTEQYKDYFEALARERHRGCQVISTRLCISQIDEYGDVVPDPNIKSGRVPLWEDLYPKE